MISKPLLSVVLSVYNGEKYLRESIDSVLAQTFTDFELIIIDDGSTDGSKKIIDSYTDKRIKLVSHENRGLVAALNEGIGKAQGKYIARQDDDDISLPNRFKTQINLLESDSSLVALGSSILVINEESQQVAEHRVLLYDEEMRAELLIRSPFAHGSMMYRADAVKKTKGYRSEYWPAEDYDLWVRLAAQGEMANIDDPLYKYRVNSQGISVQNEAAQREKKNLIAKEARTSVDLKLPGRKHLNTMIKRYTIEPTFFYRKRFELLLANYLQLSRTKGFFSMIMYIVRLLTCLRVYTYGLKVVRHRFSV